MVSVYIVKDKCSMQGCEFSATDTDTIWKVDPINTSEKPVCSYHSAQRRFLESGAFPVLMIGITYLLSLRFFSTDGLLGFASELMFFFLLTSIALFFSVMALEYSLRYLLMDKSVLKITQSVKEENGDMDQHSCVECDASNTEGVWREYNKQLEFLGTPVKTYDTGINVYCSECYENTTSKDSKNRNEELSVEKSH